MNESEPTTTGIESPPAAADGTGLRRAGQRPLAPEERRVVRGQARWLAAAFAGTALGFWVVLFVALGTAAFIPEAQGLARGVAILATLLLAAGTIGLMLAARHLLRESRALTRDARRGSVQRYEGVPLPSGPTALRRPLRPAARRPKADSEVPSWFEVLPHSGLLWQAGHLPEAEPLRRWARLLPPEPIEVAATPAFAATAAEWTEAVPGSAAPLRLGQRELAEDERRELRQQRRRALRSRLAVILPLDLWFAAVLGFGLRAGPPPHESGGAFRHDALSFLWLTALTVLANVALVRVLRAARALAQDAQNGRVAILRYPLQAEGDAETERWVTVELLPVSDAVWTIDGEPASWRSRA